MLTYGPPIDHTGSKAPRCATASARKLRAAILCLSALVIGAPVGLSQQGDPVWEAATQALNAIGLLEQSTFPNPYPLPSNLLISVIVIDESDKDPIEWLDVPRYAETEGGGSAGGNPTGDVTLYPAYIEYKLAGCSTDPSCLLLLMLHEVIHAAEWHNPFLQPTDDPCVEAAVGRRALEKFCHYIEALKADSGLQADLPFLELGSMCYTYEKESGDWNDDYGTPGPGHPCPNSTGFSPLPPCPACTT